MPPVLPRFFSFDDLVPQQDGQLLKWSRRNGADEFTLNALYVETKSDRLEAFFEKMKIHRRPSSSRRRLHGQPLHRIVDLWTLSDSSEDLLREAFPEGYATTWTHSELWLEDLTLYRGGEFLMGVFTLESGGVIRVTALELEDLRAAGFPDHESLEYMDF